MSQTFSCHFIPVLPVLCIIGHPGCLGFCATLYIAAANRSTIDMNTLHSQFVHATGTMNLYFNPHSNLTETTILRMQARTGLVKQSINYCALIWDGSSAITEST